MKGMKLVKGMKTAHIFMFFIALLVFTAPAAAQQFDPQYRFRVIQTEHFEIYFHQGEDATAQRLAGIAEETWHALRDSLGRTAPAKTHVILVDQTDLANGWATPVPRDTIAIYAVWPAASDTLKSDDWLRLAFVHEYTHILHLDRSEGWARAVRGLFGRVPLAFPNLFLPGWQIEGLATYEESLLTGTGRMHAGDFRAVVGEAAREGRLLPLDRVNGGLTRWPSGQAPYAYGLGFHKYLADLYGVRTLTELADRTARSLPYFGALAFKRVYGKELGVLWRDYQSSLAASAAPAPASAAQRLTHHEFIVTGPRFVGSDIYYSVRNADELPSLYRLRASTPSTAPERVATRIFGSTTAPGRERIYFDQQESRRNAGLYSDLHSLDPATGNVRRLTREARLIDPDLSPDQRTLVAVRIRPGERELVLVHLGSSDAIADVTTLLSEPGAQFNAPRWSPDGRAIAASRQRTGALPEIVIVAVDTKAARVIASGSGTRWATPTWRPDGRGVVAAGATGDDPFNLYEIDVATAVARRLTNSTGGATWPVVSSDGRSIVYVEYRATGYELFRIAYPTGPVSVVDVAEVRPEPQNPRTSEPQNLPSSPYTPWSTLSPTSWFPVVAPSDDLWRIGAGVTGADVLGYHAYGAEITALAGAPSNAPAPRLNWDFSYVYGRWRPGVFASAARETSFLRVLIEDTNETAIASRDETDVEVGVFVPVSHIRSRHLFVASYLRGTSTLATTFDAQSAARSAARMAWSFQSAHHFGRSISPERGVATGITAELVRRAIGADANATTITADARAYLPGFRRHHVVALRGAAGVTRGDQLSGRLFLLGGGEPNASPIDFSSDAISLMRGFEANTFAGTRVGLINLDYRFPLARIERGAGTLPIFLHTLHGAVFADAGQIWTRRFAASHLKTSFGVELSARLVLGYWANISVAAGLARGHDGSGRVRDQTIGYARAGYAF